MGVANMGRMPAFKKKILQFHPSETTRIKMVTSLSFSPNLNLAKRYPN